MSSKKKSGGLVRQLYPSLSTGEISFYTAGWIFGVGYAFYNVFKASKRYYYSLSQTELELGWKIFGGNRKDGTDVEWAVFSDMLLSSLPWMFLHLIGSQWIKKYWPKYLYLFQAFVSIIYLYKNLGLFPLFHLLLQPLLFYITLKLSNNSVFVWALGMSYITIFQWYYPMKNILDYFIKDLDRISNYIISVTVCWVNARCISYCLDNLWGLVTSKETHIEEFISFIAYCFYLPVCIGGPIINYQVYQQGINSDYQPWDSKKIIDFAKLIIRYSFWFVFCQFTLHYFYFSAIQFYSGIMTKLDLWTFFGVGYAMGQFFHLKYVIFYGFPRPFVLADGIDAPPHPKCIGRIHLYNDMWRYFDNGLYLFLHKYIFVPVLGEREGLVYRLLTSAVVFSFIYVWHGVIEHVLIWSILNYIGVTLIGLGKAIGDNPSYCHYENKIFSPRGKRRFHALLGAPLFLMSIISNFYFFMGTTNGHLYMEKGWTSWPWGTPITLFFMYCAAHTSIEVKNWEIRHKLLSMQELNEETKTKKNIVETDKEK